jgi:two-component system response regulator HydG
MDAKILIVEDQFIEANNLRTILKRAGYSVCSIAASVTEALSILKDEKPQLVLLDIYLQGKLTGIDLAKILNERNIAFVFLSANSNKRILDAAKATMPYGFLVKPFREKDVLVTLDVAWYLHRQNHSAAIQHKSQPRAHSNDDFKEIVATSESMVGVLNHISVAGPSDISVLILGESGTGKELVAHSIHRVSSRKTKPFVVINCAAIPSNLIESELFGHEKGAFTGASDKRVGKFEQADEGTVFLDEIGELPIDLQVKLLRILQEREVEPIGGQKKKIDIRIIAATNRILEEEIAARRFRLDLYYRLNVFSILLPPLRERKSDILALANHFVIKYSQKENKNITGFSDQVIKTMLAYSWPGNIRELENAVARSVLFATADIIDNMQLGPNQNLALNYTPSSVNKTIDENERDYIIAMIEKCNGKIYGSGGAAEIMNIHTSTLKSRMKKLGIENKKKTGLS